MLSLPQSPRARTQESKLSIDLTGAVGEVSMQVSITRKDTGLVEHFTLTGVVNQKQFDELVAAGMLPKPGEKNGK